MAHLRGYPNKHDRSAYFNYNLRSKRAADGPFEFGLVIGDPCDHSAFFKKCKTAGFRYRRNVLPRRIEISFRGGRRNPLHTRMPGTASNSRLNHFLPFNLGITTKFVVRYRRADVASTKTALDPAEISRTSCTPRMDFAQCCRNNGSVTMMARTAIQSIFSSNFSVLFPDRYLPWQGSRLDCAMSRWTAPMLLGSYSLPRAASEIS